MAATEIHSQGEQNAFSTRTTSFVPGGSLINNVSLYVGDLDSSVDDRQLYGLFSEVAEVVSIRVCRDPKNHLSLGYAYVNFKNQRDASYAREVLNFTPINGKPIRIMLYHKDPTMRKTTGNANLFIKNLEESIDSGSLYDTFSHFGNILSCKVALDSNGKSKGYGFIQYDNEESAQNAIKRLNGMCLNDKKVHIGLFVCQEDRLKTNESQKFTNVYVKNLPETITVEDFRVIFEKYGAITSAVVMTDANGKSRCFGFINFQKPEDAASAVENMNATSLSDKVLYVGKAQKKAEREAELKAKYEQETIARYEKLKGANLYMKNLDDDMKDEKLMDLFSQFGTITSCKVLVDSQRVSKGVGFVAFSSPEEAKRALNEMNGKMIGKKPLYVAISQRKDERRAQLQAYFAQLRSLQAGVPVYQYHPQGYSFQQQGPCVTPSFVMPYRLQLQGQHNPHQQQLNTATTGYIVNGHTNALMMQFPFTTSSDVKYSSSSDIRYSVPMATVATIATTTASASPETRRKIMGELLLPIMQRLVPEYASKVISMLLDLDPRELIHLIESPDALRKKVAAWEGLLSASSE